MHWSNPKAPRDMAQFKQIKNFLALFSKPNKLDDEEAREEESNNYSESGN